MITLITGNKGSGKTFLMTKLALKQWKIGKDIYTPYKLYFVPLFGVLNLFERLQNFIFDSSLFKERFAKIRCQRGKIYMFRTIAETFNATNALILFDEGQVFFYARNFESLPEVFMLKLTQSRKDSVDMITTTQHISMIDVQYHRVLDTWIHVDRLIQLRINFRRFRKEFISLHRVRYMNIVQLYISREVEMIEAEKVRFFIIHLFKKRLYDTLSHIDFKPVKILCLSSQKKQNKYYLIPTKERVKI